MPSIKVVSVISVVADMLTDEWNVRWPKKTLLRWFNEAQRALVARRPDALVVNEPFGCASGPKQALPAKRIRLADVYRNIGGSAITRIDRSVIDAHMRDWYSHPESAAIQHFVYDERDPKHFYVYPPAEDGAEVELAYTISPDEVEISDFTADSQTIAVDDVYANALQEYMLYKAWMKDADFAGNSARAQSHFNQFRLAIGDITQADTIMVPQDG
ncbi:MAG: hypothetical protein KDA17_03840 [Candidatus Saccharibacteria bacterium]|nr:hypothetical protein [Candidatus Saccharibacteria bacterium]